MEASSSIVQVEGYDLETFEKKVFSHEECEFAYRNSIFKNALRGKFLITAVMFGLQKLDEKYSFVVGYPDLQKALVDSPLPEFPENGLKKLSGIIAEIRNAKLPSIDEVGTAGSFFENPVIEKSDFENLLSQYPQLVSYPQADGRVKLSAGQLIDLAGLKGYSNGKAGTSPKHALIIVNE